MRPLPLQSGQRPPSVLISQLRDTLAQGWQLPANAPQLLKAITVEHPLQPFSPQYIKKNRDPRLFTYSREWFEASNLAGLNSQGTVTANEKNFTLTLESLARFLKAPVKTFCNNTLKFGFDDETITSEDNEPFGFNPLEKYVLSQELLEALKNEVPDKTDAFFEQRYTALARKGKLPLGGFAHAAYADLEHPVNQAWQKYPLFLSLWPVEIEARVIDLSFSLPDNITFQLTGDLSNLRQSGDLQSAMISLTAQALLTDANKIKYPNLLLNWIQHLAGCAVGMNLKTLVIGSDSVIEIEPIAKAEAQEQLKTLVEAWNIGMQAPLPVACKTAFAYLSAAPEKAMEDAQAKYEGDDWNSGEVDYDAYLSRFFPNFANLKPEAEHEGFVDWAVTLYLSAFKQIKLQQTEQGAQS